MTDWRTHHKGQWVFCFCVIFSVCLISKITKKSHSKMEMFNSSPFKAPPVVHISFITTLQADVDHGPGKIQGWFFFHQGPGWIWRWFSYRPRAWQNSGLIVYLPRWQGDDGVFLKTHNKIFHLRWFLRGDPKGVYECLGFVWWNKCSILEKLQKANFQILGTFVSSKYQNRSI